MLQMEWRQANYYYFMYSGPWCHRQQFQRLFSLFFSSVFCTIFTRAVPPFPFQRSLLFFRHQRADNRASNWIYNIINLMVIAHARGSRFEDDLGASNSSQYDILLLRIVDHGQCDAAWSFKYLKCRFIRGLRSSKSDAVCVAEHRRRPPNTTETFDTRLINPLRHMTPKHRAHNSAAESKRKQMKMVQFTSPEFETSQPTPESSKWLNIFFIVNWIQSKHRHQFPSISHQNVHSNCLLSISICSQRKQGNSSKIESKKIK